MNKGRIVTIHQPEFIPWLGFFNKVWQSDVFIIMDDVQFKKNHFENRNKIRVLSEQGWTWIKIPVFMKGRFGQKICDVDINSEGEKRWKEVLLKSVKMSYQKTKFFPEVYEMIESCINQNTDKLCDINICLILAIMKYLDMNKNVIIQSQLAMASAKEYLLVDLIKKSGCDTYLSGQSGKVYLDHKVMTENGITVLFQNFNHPQYEQVHGNFLKGMSIIDLLFNYGKESVDFLKDVNYERLF